MDSLFKGYKFYQVELSAFPEGHSYVHPSMVYKKNISEMIMHPGKGCGNETRIYFTKEGVPIISTIYGKTRMYYVGTLDPTVKWPVESICEAIQARENLKN